MLSHETAAELYGLIDRPSRKISITVPHSRRPAQQGSINGVVIHRSDVSRPQPPPQWQLPRTRIEDTVLDLVATAATLDDAYSWVSRAVAERLVTIGGRTHYKDNLYEKYGVCVEIDGPAYHRAERVQKDKDRDNLNLAADGVQTYRFGPVNVTERACESAAVVADSLERNGWEGQPHPCRRPGCMVGRPLREHEVDVAELVP